MDFGNAALLVLVTLGAVTLAKTGLRIIDQRVVVLLTVAVSLAVVFLVAETVWADEQMIGGTPLSMLGVADKIVVGILLACAETGAYLGLDAVRNVGQNQPKPVDPRLLPRPGEIIGEPRSHD